MRTSKNLHWLLYLFIATMIACARQTAPTGGPKDTIPPKLWYSNPKNEQVNFHGNAIELTFTEPVELALPKEQLIITPTIGKDYEIQAKKDKVILKWDQPLLDSTTYTFNFREAVKDITEKNPVRNLRLAVSTGSFIDSLTVQGEIRSALEQTPVKDVTVALQPYSDTFNILKHPPTYFTKSNDKGVYLLENLKNGRYLLYAFIDQNRNLFVDSKSERFGFVKEILNLDSGDQKVNIPIVKRDMRPLKITSARPYNTYFNIRTSKNIEGVSIKATDSIATNYALGADRSNILVYNNYGNVDSVLLNVTLYDSIENRIDTTLYAKFSTQAITPEKFQTTPGKITMVADKGLIKGTVSFTKPLSKIVYDSIIFKVDSLNHFTFTEKDFSYNQVEKVLTFTKKIDPLLYKKAESQPGEEAPAPDSTKTQKIKKLNELHFGSGAFISIEQDSSTISNQKLTPLYYEDLGVIIISVYTKQTSKTLIELVSKDKVISSRVNEANITFEDLPPDDYQIRLIIDTNGNGKWDAGNYLKREEPEEIIYYQNEKRDRTVKLKANFEIGPLLITY
jgi:uncharacterized protein (DUF2141 family)